MVITARQERKREAHNERQTVRDGGQKKFRAALRPYQARCRQPVKTPAHHGRSPRYERATGATGKSIRKVVSMPPVWTRHNPSLWSTSVTKPVRISFRIARTISCRELRLFIGKVCRRARPAAMKLGFVKHGTINYYFYD